MATIGGTVDVLALAKDAFQLYHIYRGSQDRYRSLCDDIIGLESTLKVLGNKLLFQGASTPDPASKATLTVGSAAAEGSALSSEELAALDHIIQQAQKLLEELHARVPATKLPRGLYRLKWSEAEVLSIRSRITALNSTIAAFSSSLVVSHVSFSARTERSQQQILSTLREVLDAVQVGHSNRPLSRASTVAVAHEDNHDKTQDDLNKSQDDEFFKILVSGMRKHGVSGVHLGENGELVVRSVSPGLGSPLPQQVRPRQSGPTTPELSWEDGLGECEVLSAVYGPRVLTKRVQRIVDNQIAAGAGAGTVQFLIENVTMGGDSLLTYRKSFAMVWRKHAVRDGNPLYSTPQCILGEEDDVITLRLNASIPHLHPQTSFNANIAPEGETQIVFASWFDVEVTARVANLVASGQTSILARSDTLHVADPKPEHVKCLSVCWTYSRGPGSDIPSPADFHTSAVLEWEFLEVPPCLRILCARNGDADITKFLQAMVSGDQTLTIDVDDLQVGMQRPQPNYPTTVSIVYRYGTRPAQILVLPGNSDPFELSHHTSVSSNVDGEGGIFDLDASRGIPVAPPDTSESSTVVAVVWGLQLMSLETPSLLEAIYNRKVPCQNEFFGVDGWEFVVKSCQVFVCSGQLIQCFVAWEGFDLDLRVPQTESTHLVQ
ncbi:hypothetical protein NLG97_g2884 [Lecanicillium saksenae]|uniref:Uncharacterized protein n=1 Tax=Lecanicillium saksenae TaxID=468837 RepID=A0ACC1R317_9HYPO|nr:hypothetical protein NLG97_g2884 [Lecanicillium saksenae]